MNSLIDGINRLVGAVVAISIFVGILFVALQVCMTAGKQ